MRDACSSHLAIGKCSVSSGRPRYPASRRLPLLSGEVRMASRRDRLVKGDYRRSDLRREETAGYALTSLRTLFGSDSRLLRAQFRRGGTLGVGLNLTTLL